MAVGLPAYGGRLDEQAHWNRMLSLGEQQRIAIARAILHAPDYLLLDEATASLDEPAEAALYRLMHDRLPGATIVSIGHRSTLAAFHKRRLTLTREGERYRRQGGGAQSRRVGNCRQRAGHEPLRTRLCQARANSASARVPIATGATRNVHGVSLSTATMGSMPAGGWNVRVRCIAIIASPTASAAPTARGRQA